MKKLHGPRWGVTALLLGAAAGGACGGQASGDYDDGAGATTGVGPGGMAGLGGAGRGGSGGRGGRGGQGGTGMAGASGRGGSAAGGQGAGGSVSVGGSAGVAGASMGGSSGMDPQGTCSSPTILGSDTTGYVNRIERSENNAFDACPGNGPEEVIRWTPPQSGRYLIDTFGSLFDTVLYVSSNLACPPTTPNPQLECNDDFSGVQSLLAVEAVQGREMLIVVDSYNRSGGDFFLNFRGEVACPSLDLGEQFGAPLYSTFEFASDARVLPLQDAPECRSGELGVTFAWRAPLAGVYRFSTGGSSFTTVLALREACEGPLIGCDFAGDINDGSEIILSMARGQEVVIEVTPEEPGPQQSFGPFVLNIESL